MLVCNYAIILPDLLVGGTGAGAAEYSCDTWLLGFDECDECDEYDECDDFGADERLTGDIIGIISMPCPVP